MSRRIVPGTFWVGILSCGLLLVQTVTAARPPDRPPNLVGIWDGFFLAADGATGHVQSVITRQDFRRIAGEGELLDLDDRVVFTAYNFNATVTGADFLTGTGTT